MKLLLILIAATLLFLTPLHMLIAAGGPELGPPKPFWSDSLLVIQLAIEKPFSEETIHTLQSGLPVLLELEMRLLRTGFVKEFNYPVKVEYNVWTDVYRVHSPAGPLAMQELRTVLRFFERDFSIFLPRHELGSEERWLFKLRAGERRILQMGEGEDALGRIEEELSGVASWLFRRRENRPSWTPWTTLMPVPAYVEPDQGGAP